MTLADQAALKAEFPEILDGNWILTRDHSLTDARKLVELRRRAFPATTPAILFNVNPATGPTAAQRKLARKAMGK